MRPWRTLYRALLLLCATGIGGAAPAATLALLVGVADYGAETGITDLKGPPNDVRLLRDVLTARGAGRIILLADGVAGAARPTRDAILTALADLAAQAGPGDFVYIHLSGHGTRQADRNGDETDALDEVFLPADTAAADTATGLITNAITDDEIGAAVDRIRTAGADVWLVMDSCHAGSGLRAAGTGVADRFVDPALLGVTDSPPARQDIAQTVRDLPETAGGVIAFYAAQSSEVAREVNLAAPGTPEAWYGLFTSRLAARLQGGGEASFRQLFQAVLRDMNDQSVPGAARLQTPLWEGDLIDAALFGGRSTSGLRRFEVTGDEISAGRLHGLTDGTIVGLVADVTNPAGAILGLAQLEGAEATTAFLRPVDATCIPRTDTYCAAVGTLPDAARFAQIVARPVDQTIGVSMPRDSSGQLLPPEHPVVAALRSAIAPPLSLSFEDARIESYWDGTALWLGQRATVGGTAIGLSWAPGTPLAPLLTRIAAAERFAGAIAPLASAPSLLDPSPVQITAQVADVSAAALVPASAGQSPRRECRAAMAAGTSPRPLSIRDALKQCDGLSVSAQGTRPGARDVNRIHIDAQFCIHASHARIDDTAMARAVGPDMTLCSDCPGGYSAGEERLFVIVTEAEDNRAPLNLEGLVENCGPAAASTRSPRAAQLSDFLDTLSQGRATRGNMGAIGIASIWVQEYTWTVLPKSEVFARSGMEP